MIKFSTTSNFDRRIADLKTVKRGVYATVEDEIRASPSQQLDISDAQLIELVRLYVDEREKQTLIPFEIFPA